MRTAVFSVRDIEKEYLQNVNLDKHELILMLTNLSETTASLADGCELTGNSARMANLKIYTHENKEDVHVENKKEDKTTPVRLVAENTLYIGLGITGLFLGGKWVVDGAIEIAQAFNLSEDFIGLTVIALGTSMPELVTSVMAALKKNTDIAVGYIVGSNIFNLLWILCISSVIKALYFDVASNVDLLMVIGSSSMVILALILGRTFIIKRTEGIIFLLAYGMYIYFLIERG